MKNQEVTNITVRLKWIMEHYNLNPNSFALKINAPRTIFYELFSGKSKTPSAETIAKVVSSIPQINSTWLLTGVGNALHEEVVPIPEKNEQQGNLAKVYLLDEDISAAAGSGDLATTTRNLESYEYLLMDGLAKNKTYARLKVRGDSMHPTIYDRDLIIACLIEERLDIALKDNYVYVLVLKSGEIAVKRVLNRIAQRGELYIKSDNPGYTGYQLHIEEVAFCWEVKMRTTFNLQNPNLEVYDAINEHEMRLTKLEQEFKKQLKLLN